jgi:hypothetical protein
MWRWSFSCELHENCNPWIAFQQWKQELIWNRKLKKYISDWAQCQISHCPLAVHISQRNEDLRLYNLVYNLTISNRGLKAVSSNASPGWTVRFLAWWSGFSERGSQDLSNGTMWPPKSPRFLFCVYVYSPLKSMKIRVETWKTLTQNERFQFPSNS